MFWEYAFGATFILGPIAIFLFVAIVGIWLGAAMINPKDSADSSSEESNSALMMGGDSEASASEESTPPTPQIPRYQKWNTSSREAGPNFSLYIVASLIVITATIINVNVTVTASYTLLPLGVTVALQSIPVLLVGLLMWLAWQVRTASGAPEVKVRFARLERVQRVIGIASILWMLPMLMFPNQFLGSETVGLGILAGYAPALTGIVALLVSFFGNLRIDESATEKVGDIDGR
jgi:hypothetical protein